MAENILVLEPGDERAQKIAKAMASQTAGDILHLLGEGQISLTDIAEKLSIPLNTAKYHLENLLEAGLVSVAETKYSVKGREVKMYSLTNQLLIVAPRQSPVRSLILKYASLFAIVLVATIGIAAFAPLLSGIMPGPSLAATQNFAPAAAPVPVPTGETGVGGAERSIDNDMAVKMAYGTGMDTTLPPAPPSSPDTALAFFLGGILVIFVLLCYEAWLWKKTR